MGLEGYAEISATHAIESIDASKAVPFSRVLVGLNIPKVGWIMAQNVVRHFETVDRLLEATQEEIEEVDGIGPSLRYATATVKKMTRTRAGDGFVPADVPDDVWDTASPARPAPVAVAA